MKNKYFKFFNKFQNSSKFSKTQAKKRWSGIRFCSSTRRGLPVTKESHDLVKDGKIMIRICRKDNVVVKKPGAIVVKMKCRRGRDGVKKLVPKSYPRPPTFETKSQSSFFDVELGHTDDKVAGSNP